MIETHPKEEQLRSPGVPPGNCGVEEQRDSRSKSLPTSPNTTPIGARNSVLSTKLQVCILTDAFYPVVGGGETHSLLLSRALVARGVGVLVMTQRRIKETPWKENLDGVQIRRVHPTGCHRWGKYLMTGSAFMRLLWDRARYDIIYVCGLRTLGLPALIAGRILKKPVILRAESCSELSGEYLLSDCWKWPAFLRWGLRKLLMLRNRLYKSAPRFLSISSAISEEFRQCGVPDVQISQITNGIDVNANCPARAGEPALLREKLGLPPNKILVVYTGKLNRGKGLELLLRAWTRLMEKRQDAHLVLVGGGANQFLSCERNLREYVQQHGLEPHVTFTGYVTNVPDYLRASDVFTLPSESEALGLSIVEAMACGLPVVVTRTGGIPDVLTHGREGIMVPVNDEAALLAALELLVANPDTRRTMGDAGRQTAVSRFSIETIADAHARLFRDLIDRAKISES